MIYVIAIGTFQAFTAVLLLWTNRLKSKADALLILLLLCIAAHLATKFYIYTVVSDAHIRFQMNTFIGFCYGPLLYLYALKNKDESFIPASRWYVFIPFILGAIGYLTVVCVLEFSLQAGYAALQIYNQTSTWSMLAAGTFFPLLALNVARKYLQQKPQERQLIEWISYCLLTISAVAHVFQGIHALNWVEDKDLIFCRDIVYSILLIVCFIIIRYKYVAVVPTATVHSIYSETVAGRDKQEQISAEKADLIDIREQSSPVRRTQLTTTEHREIMDKLEQHLQRTRIFTDADLNMDKLAGSVGISKYHLSEALNSYASKSFYQFINEMRIERAIQQMQFMSSKALPVNVLTLAFDCGFKAKSSFNQYFKKITGLTPTAYLRSVAEMRAETL
ncbi:AraC family transcriptional regulator [Chitinophaga sp. YR627]|uniref:AraC family transcriptional regulator n=1 Tax=Chitinophaga sp. YR627 TaxID=1881041 RepID=UPI000ABCC9FD|nr:helix-turn-helix domain-containing protein [Chitinophaga sp. YR627]